MSIKKGPHFGSAFPSCQFVLRQRIEDAVVHNDLPPHGTKLPLTPRLAANKPRDRFTPSGDNHLLARLDLRQQAGEMSLGLMDVVGLVP